MNDDNILTTNKPESSNPGIHPVSWWNKSKLLVLFITGIIVSLITGSIAGYQLGKHQTADNQPVSTESETSNMTHLLSAQVNPPQGYTVPVKYGTIGPQLLRAGAINYDQFEQIYAQSGKPLTDEQKTILKEGRDQEIRIDSQNAYFLLNFFWAFGLTNKNPILTEGPMMQGGREAAGNYASTSGWTLGAKAPMELYASVPMVMLNKEQQARLLKVASAVYRPCCDNPTHFPDCNHGMAMLGLLELMASQNATEDQMFNAAKYVNGFWYPQQSFEIATVFYVLKQVDFDHISASDLVGRGFSSGTAYQNVHNYLVQKNLLQEAPGQGGSCGVQ